MPSPRRDHRSRSGSRSPEPPSKGKRSLDLVSTRRYSPPNHFRGRGRGRGMRRPFVRYNEHGTTIFRGTSQRYYPRHSRREDTKNRRSHSRSPERSRSHDRHRKSRSSSSSSHHHERSKSHDKRRPSIKDRSRSPEHKKKKADRRSDDASESRHSRRTRSSSHQREASHSRSKVKTDYTKYPETTEYEAKSSKYVEAPAYDDAKYSDRKRREEEEEDERRGKGKRYREASRSPEDGKRNKKMATSVPASTAGRSKETIPRNRLHKIFSLISQDVDFELDEDISIAIQRNPYAEPSEDSTVTVVFDEALFNMIYPYEGRKHRPIFDREEIKMFGHDKNLADDPDFERRVIRVKPGKSSTHADQISQSSSYRFGGGLEITRTVNRGRSRSFSSGRSRSPPSPLTNHETKFRLRLSTDPRFEARYSELHRKEEAGTSRHDLDPTDLRHELRKASGDARQRLERERGDRDVGRRSSDDRERSDNKKGKEELPDFSRRKDKYQYTPWLDQPELIPKDPKYFQMNKQQMNTDHYLSQHDDRDNNRGRGRGMFRGQRGFRRPFRPFRSRGGFRGNFGGNNYRGRGNYMNRDVRDRERGRSRSPQRAFSSFDARSYEREWKHDKFSELEHDDDKKHDMDAGSSMEHPHSTSER